MFFLPKAFEREGGREKVFRQLKFYKTKINVLTGNEEAGEDKKIKQLLEFSFSFFFVREGFFSLPGHQT